jgi:hypothetical protein
VGARRASVDSLPVSASISRSERQLILLSAGTAARRLARCDQARQLAVEVDWSRLAPALRLRRLLSVLGPRIIELSDGEADEDFAVAVEQALQAGRRQGAFFQLVSLRLIAALAQAGIPASALKGPLLGEALYGDPGRRLSSDIDLLVAPDDLNAAVEVVRSLGYGAPLDHVQGDGLPLLHFVLVHEQGQLPSIELHWRVHWYERRFAYERLLPGAPDASGQWRPEPADELAALLLFYARDGFVDMRLASDLGAWWDVRGAKLAPGALMQVLAAYPELARAIPAALAAAERVVGLPTVEILAKRRRLDVRQRLAVRLVNPNPSGSASQLYADMGLVDGLLAPAGGFGAFVRRQLLPPAEVLDQQARHGSRRRARSRAGRAVGVLGRYGVTLARAASGARTDRP